MDFGKNGGHRHSSVNIVMDIETQFRNHLLEHGAKTGVQPPALLLDYLVLLLSSRLCRTDIIPDPSFAERWLLLHQQPAASAFLDYADTCLFFTSLLPEYGHRRGLKLDYYATLGISAYHTAAGLADELCYRQLGDNFYFLQQFLNSAIKPEVRLELFKF